MQKRKRWNLVVQVVNWFGIKQLVGLLVDAGEGVARSKEKGKGVGRLIVAFITPFESPAVYIDHETTDALRGSKSGPV